MRVEVENVCAARGLVRFPKQAWVFRYVAATTVKRSGDRREIFAAKASLCCSARVKASRRRAVALTKIAITANFDESML